MSETLVPSKRSPNRRRGIHACGLALLTLTLAAGGCDERHNMEEDAHLKPFEGIAFFPGGSSAQAAPDNTVARGQLNADSAYFRGRDDDGQLLGRIPVEVTQDLVARGRQRFTIYCAPCHGLDGYGQGMIVKRGFSPPPSMHEDRLVAMPDGHFFDVITNGFGKMSPYAAQVPVDDRWAITAYIRALQLSQHARPEDVPPPEATPETPAASPSHEGAHHE